MRGVRAENGEGKKAGGELCGGACKWEGMLEMKRKRKRGCGQKTYGHGSVERRLRGRKKRVEDGNLARF